MSIENSTADILVVDDTPANLQLLVSNLSQHGYHVRAVTDGRLALMAANAAPPDLILLDVMMPNMDGYQVCQALKANEKLKDIPVIFISALDETLDKIKGFRAGGSDYVSKPFQFDEVLARVETHITIYRQKRALEKARAQDQQYFAKLTQLKNDFVSTASHDLKNPLTNIKLVVDLLKRHRKFDDEELMVKYLETIDHQVVKMQTLIKDMLDLVRLETGRALVYEPIGMSKFIGDTLAEFAFPAEQKEITLSFTPTNPELFVYLDHKQMQHVLHNLISNAIKYTPRGGQVEVVLQKEKEQCHLQIVDTGLGIPEEDVPYIFDRFYRVKNEAHIAIEGTGLGLSIVKSIVEQHRGEIWVDTTLGRGSTFHIVLPS